MSLLKSNRNIKGRIKFQYLRIDQYESAVGMVESWRSGKEAVGVGVAEIPIVCELRSRRKEKS